MVLFIWRGSTPLRAHLRLGRHYCKCPRGHVHGRATLSPNPETPFITGPFLPHTLCGRHSTIQIASCCRLLPPQRFFRRFFPPSGRFPPPPVRATFFPQWPSKRLFLQPARPWTTLVRSHKVQSANQTSHITKASVVSPRIRIQDGGFSTRFGPSLCATSRRFFFFPQGRWIVPTCCPRVVAHVTSPESARSSPEF